MRVVIDTNALVAVRFRPGGAAARLMARCISGEVEAVYTRAIRDENEDVIGKVRPPPSFLRQLRAFYAAATELVEVPPVQVAEDPSDNKFVACALAGGADCIISSDRHLLDLDGYEGLRVCKAAVFFEEHPALGCGQAAPLTGNLFAGCPTDLTEELLDPLVSGKGVRIERIVSDGHASPPGFWYDQPHAEWVAVLRGRARLQFEGERDSVELGEGDWVHISAHARHRVEWSAPGVKTVWLAVHFG